TPREPGAATGDHTREDAGLAFEDVGVGDEGERLVVRPDREDLEVGVDHVHEVAVEQGHALRVPGGAGGVDDRVDVVRADLRQAAGDLGDRVGRRLPAQPGGHLVIEANDLPQGPALLQRRGRL